mgnify:CR=1 FL=1
MRGHIHKWVALGLLLLAAAGGCQHMGVRGQRALEETLPSLTPSELFEIALFQAGRGDLMRAEQYLSAARSEGFSESLVVYWLVRVCVSAGRYHSALDHASEYLRAHPSNWRLRLVVASIHEALGDLARARVEMESIVRGYPSHPLPHYRLAMLYQRLPVDVERTSRHLRAYLSLDPAGPHAAEVRIALERASEKTALEPLGVGGALGPETSVP